MVRVAMVLVLLVLAVPASGTGEAVWRAVRPGLASDSLPAALQALATQAGPGIRPGEAEYALGQYRYARGEYRAAADAFARAHARLAAPDRDEARYAFGLAQLALGEPARARSAFEDLAAAGGRLRALVLLGVAQCWEAEHHPERAFDTLHRLLAGPPGEAGPAALERYAALAASFRRENDARDALARLTREYPASVEAARALAPATYSSAPAGRGPIVVQIGVFADRTRAESLLESARRAGFDGSRIESRAGEGGRPRAFVVVLGTFASPEQAKAAGERAGRTLGVGWQLQSR
jgi:tetratricopeptide (TPR) repeat protein